MRIAVFAWEALEGIAVGGGAVYASHLAAALARAGHRVRLFTRLGPGQAIDDVVGRVAVRRCPWDGKRHFVDEIAALAQSFAHYYQDAARLDGGYDIVHCHEWLTMEAGLRAVEAYPARLAVGFSSTEWSRTGAWPERGDSARIAAVEARALSVADAASAVSHHVKRYLDQQFHPPEWKTGVVYHGIDLAPFDGEDFDPGKLKRGLGIDVMAPMVLFAGRFSRNNGGDLAAAAAGLVSRENAGIRFVFVGSGPLEAEMRFLAGPSALFVPPPAGGVPAALFRACDVVLAPARLDANGRAVLPAWAASKPAIVLKGGAASEFVIDGVNGCIVEASQQGLALAILELFSDFEFCRWMGRNGRVAVETTFTWDEAARKISELYERRLHFHPV